MATSTNMNEYVTLSSALRYVIPIMELIYKLEECVYDLISTNPIVSFKGFEDNFGALEITRLP